MNSALYVAPLAVLFGMGCSSRSTPTTFPPESPASDSATEAERAPVTNALDEDPPLPGEPSEGWSGLDAPPESAPEPGSPGHEHQHEHHHHHGTAPAAPPSGKAEPTAPTEAAPAVTYVCPMHPEVVSDRAGRCPKCGMNLEPRP